MMPRTLIKKNTKLQMLFKGKTRGEGHHKRRETDIDVGTQDTRRAIEVEQRTIRKICQELKIEVR